MPPILLHEGLSPEAFRRVDLKAGLAEKFLQDLLFDQPALLPLAELDPSLARFIPICKELRLPRIGGDVFLDIFGMTHLGQLVLIECKLWRNPQARREVVAQILEYAAILRRWSFADLTAAVRKRCGLTSANPLYDLALRSGATLAEQDFTDAVSRNLRNGDFNLIIAGDGIREDTSIISSYISDQGLRLALVEIQIWEGDSGKTLVLPVVPFRTEISRQRVLIDTNDVPIRLAEEPLAAPLPAGSDGTLPERKGENRIFWQRFIDEIAFSHADQPAPRHGGNNWVRIPLPPPALGITAYRDQGRAGLFLVEKPGTGLQEALLAEMDAIRSDLPGAYALKGRPENSSARLAVQEPEGTPDQLAWLIEAADRFVTVVRLRLSQFGSASETPAPD